MYHRSEQAPPAAGWQSVLAGGAKEAGETTPGTARTAGREKGGEFPQGRTAKGSLLEQLLDGASEAKQKQRMYEGLVREARRRNRAGAAADPRDKLVALNLMASRRRFGGNGEWETPEEDDVNNSHAGDDALAGLSERLPLVAPSRLPRELRATANAIWATDGPPGIFPGDPFGDPLGGPSGPLGALSALVVDLQPGRARRDQEHGASRGDAPATAAGGPGAADTAQAQRQEARKRTKARQIARAMFVEGQLGRFADVFRGADEEIDRLLELAEEMEQEEREAARRRRGLTAQERAADDLGASLLEVDDDDRSPAEVERKARTQTAALATTLGMSGQTHRAALRQSAGEHRKGTTEAAARRLAKRVNKEKPEAAVAILRKDFTTAIQETQSCWVASQGLCKALVDRCEFDDTYNLCKPKNTLVHSQDYAQQLASEHVTPTAIIHNFLEICRKNPVANELDILMLHRIQTLVRDIVHRAKQKPGDSTYDDILIFLFFEEREGAQAAAGDTDSEVQFDDNLLAALGDGGSQDWRLDHDRLNLLLVAAHPRLREMFLRVSIPSGMDGTALGRQRVAFKEVFGKELGGEVDDNAEAGVMSTEDETQVKEALAGLLPRLHVIFVMFPMILKDKLVGTLKRLWDDLSAGGGWSTRRIVCAVVIGIGLVCAYPVAHAGICNFVAPAAAAVGAKITSLFAAAHSFITNGTIASALGEAGTCAAEGAFSAEAWINYLDWKNPVTWTVISTFTAISLKTLLWTVKKLAYLGKIPLDLITRFIVERGPFAQEVAQRILKNRLIHELKAKAQAKPMAENFNEDTFMRTVFRLFSIEMKDDRSSLGKEAEAYMSEAESLLAVDGGSTPALDGIDQATELAIRGIAGKMMIKEEGDMFRDALEQDVKENEDEDKGDGNVGQKESMKDKLIARRARLLENTNRQLSP